MKTAIVLIAVLAGPAIVFSQTTYYVPDDFGSIQDAINACNQGDTVIVRAGTWVENIDFLGKAIHLKSEMGSNDTIIDGSQSGSVVTFQNNETSDSVIEGFTITNGKTTSYGGGINCHFSSPVISKNIITGNSTFYWGGGGISCYDGSPTITGNTISGNFAKSSGGGIDCSHSSLTIITSNSITGNMADTWGGGGIYCGSCSPTITYNIISGNSAVFWGGGGIHCEYSSSPAIIGNTISGNATDRNGGGIYCDSSDPIITSNILAGNSAGNLGGGGIYCYQSSPSIINNTLSGNTAVNWGGGVCCYDSSDPTITNNTISGNSADYGGGICCCDYSDPIITSTILWDNYATKGPEMALLIPYSSISISYSDVKGGSPSGYVEFGCVLNWGLGMIDADPLFIDPAGSDYHLKFPSPCKDSGDNSAVTELTDFEGDLRIAYGTVDMGADEFYTHLYYTGDATPGGNVQIKLVGLPGASPLALCAGTGVLDHPIPTKWGAWWNEWWLKFPIIGPIGLGSIPSPDGVYVLPTALPPDIPGPYAIPLQAFIGDSLTNLSVMEVE